MHRRIDRGNCIGSRRSRRAPGRPGLGGIDARARQRGRKPISNVTGRSRHGSRSIGRFDRTRIAAVRHASVRARPPCRVSIFGPFGSELGRAVCAVRLPTLQFARRVGSTAALASGRRAMGREGAASVAVVQRNAWGAECKGVGAKAGLRPRIICV